MRAGVKEEEGGVAFTWSRLFLHLFIGFKNKKEAKLVADRRSELHGGWSYSP